MAKPKSFAYFCALVSLFCFCFCLSFLCMFLSLCIHFVSFCQMFSTYALRFHCCVSLSACISFAPPPPHCLLRRIIVPLCMCTYLSKLALSNSLIKQLVNIETTSKTTNYTHTHRETDILYVCIHVCYIRL